MARALLIVDRGGRVSDISIESLELLNRRLVPDNIVPRQPAVAYEIGVTAAVLNPNGAALLHGTSVCVGALLDGAKDWHRPGSPPPDGSYALLRSSADSVELVADPAGSRTIWYALTEDRLVASTSQRAIVAVLGSFALCRDALAWMLSSGTLGPFGAWDTRLQHLRPGERVVLDRARWKLSRHYEPPVYAPDRSCNTAEHRQRLTEAVRTVCAQWRFDTRKWLLPLSGGVDSRGLLLELHDRPGLRTVTWGTSSALELETSDAAVARKLAETVGVSHRYYVTDLSNEPREQLLERFLTAGEGRIARISGYTDGFQIWKLLFEEGIDGIVRGDEAFGTIPVPNDYNARFRQGLTVMSDYFGPEQLASFELPQQAVPEHLARQPGETVATWRDRGYLQFRVPMMLAALTDLKAAYVEVANPLLSRRVLECVRQLPDELRTAKRLWREIVASESPDLPYARSSAVLQFGDFVKDPAVIEAMLGELASASAREIFAPPLLAQLLRTVKSRPKSERNRLFGVTFRLPPGLKTLARDWVGVKPELPMRTLAFRVFIASRMNALLQEDARVLLARPRRAAAR
jgi:hypothetical protein